MANGLSASHSDEVYALPAHNGFHNSADTNTVEDFGAGIIWNHDVARMSGAVWLARGYSGFLGKGTIR